MTMKRTTRAALTLGLAAGVSALATGAMAQSCTTKIGAVLPTSVDWGRPIAEVAQFAVDQVNEAGGAAGCASFVVMNSSSRVSSPLAKRWPSSVPTIRSVP